jgi:hypothetical protein
MKTIHLAALNCYVFNEDCNICPLSSETKLAGHNDCIEICTYYFQRFDPKLSVHLSVFKLPRIKKCL